MKPGLPRRILATTLGLALAGLGACSDDPTEPARPDADTAAADGLSDQGPGPDADVVTPDGPLPDVPAVDADGGAPDTPAETEPPDLRDVRITLQGAVSQEVALGDADQVRIIPGPGSAGFRVLVTDNETDAQDLVVEIVGADGEPVADQQPAFSNGLWKIDVPIAPGMSLRVRARDAAGNVAETPYALVIPTLAEALVATWNTRFHDNLQNIVSEWSATWTEDGAWTEDREADGAASGTWEITAEGALRVAEDGADAVVAAFYVDQNYFSPAAWTRSAGQSGVEGTWARTLTRYDAAGALLEERVETLEFTADAWTETWTGTSHESGVETPIDRSWSGTWRVELDENYTNSVGDFLVRDVEVVDGSALAEPEQRFELHVTRLDKLLILPKVRD